MTGRALRAFRASSWMKNELRLADEYRADGRIADAQPIEERLSGFSSTPTPTTLSSSD